MRSSEAVMRRACLFMFFILCPLVLGAKPDLQTVEKRVRQGHYKFRVGPNPATRYPLERLCGLKIPPNFSARQPKAPLPPQPLPESFDWRALGGCTPVKDQGGCGSCWAFAAMGTAESQYLIQSGKELDFSEQWLVSCTEAGTCDGGWYGTAFDFMINTKDACNVIGAPLEEMFPYEADDVGCNCNTGDLYILTEWAAIGQNVEAIKQAIMTYGPVAVGVAADDMFQCYVGGVFDADASTDLNHAVVLVGWDDTQGKSGIWFLRNSWGPGWGEGGYMRIEYGCNGVGASPAYAQLVPKSEPNYLNVPDPYPTIAAALAAAGNSDVITLSPGIYTGPGNTNISFGGKNVVIRSLNPSNPEVRAQTVIDCQSSGRAFTFMTGEDSAATLDGLTIRNGSINDNGGAIYCYYASPTIKNCTFENNRTVGAIAKKNGGAIALYNSSPTILNCRFVNNIATGAGGAISCRDGSSAVVTHCEILNNTAGLEGGGLYSWINSIVKISHTVIAGNHAGTFGGGLYFEECTALGPTDPNIQAIDFITLADNSTDGYGGGICLWDSRMKINNSIVWNNSAAQSAGGQIALVDDSLDETFLAVNYCDVTGLDAGHLLDPANSPECTLEWGQGNFEADPLFVNAAARDYYVKSASGHWEPTTRQWILDDGGNYDPADDENSPCIDAGDPAVEVTNEYKCNGNKVNIGAYGNTEQASRSYDQQCCMMCFPSDFNCDCRVNLEDLVYMMQDWLSCNYLPRHYCDD
ncbi:MAG: right-handed parallel beta-helix repeat-containing protein [Planctomycetaceae bacterium]|nr:right-handed parallel beta-helix repeat-containing protein [Planctomycetaceae bacterium]